MSGCTHDAGRDDGSVCGAEATTAVGLDSPRCAEHAPPCTWTTIGQSFMNDLWDVTCACGFKVTNLGTREAAADTVAWHKGEPSALGRDLHHTQPPKAVDQ